MQEHSLNIKKKKGSPALPEPRKQIFLSKIHRDKLKKREKELHTASSRATLPQLTRDEIRRYRLPYNEAILGELFEKGYIHSKEYLSQLMKWQEKFREEHEYEIAVMARPLLRDSKNIINNLVKGLISAESNHFQGNVAGEIDSFLLLAVEYGFTDDSDWYWLAEQLFRQCIQLSTDFTDDGGFRKAESQYIYGKFLLEKGISDDEGISFLTEAANLSRNTITWKASKILKKSQKTIFVECSILLYEVYFKLAKSVLMSDPPLALELCYQSRERAQDACLPRADVLLLQGKCEIENSLPHKAVISFQKAHLLYKCGALNEENCEACICLALAYLDMGNWKKSYEELIKLWKFATHKNMPLYIGKSNLYIGQYHLNQGTPDRATPYLVEALNIFHELNDVANMEFVKNLAAVSKSQELIEKYVELILRCEDTKKSGENILKLLNWKNTRFPFWEDMSESSKTDFCSEIMTFVGEPFGEDENLFQDQPYFVEYKDGFEGTHGVHNVSEALDTEDNE